MVESGGLVALELSLHVATDVTHSRRAVHLQQEQAQPVAHLRQGQRRRQLLTLVRLADQEPYSYQRQGHMVMPALPRAHLGLVHAYLSLASFETRLNAGARLDDSRQFRKRGLLKCCHSALGRREVVMIAVAGVVVGGIARGASLQRAIVRQWTTGDHQPFFGSGAFALQARLHPAFDHLDSHRTLLTVSPRQSPPGSRIERLAPSRHRLPGWLWTTTTALIRGWQRFEVTHRGGAGHAQHIALAALTQRLAKPRVAAELIITGDPTVWDVRTPRVEHLQTLLLARLVMNLWWHVTCLTPLLIAYPFLRQIQPEVEQGMLIIRNIAHEDANLAVVDFAPMPTPLAFDPDRMGAALGETARIEGDDAIGLAQAMDYLRHQHLDQRAMIPWRGANELLDDLSLDINERGDVLGIF